MVDARREKELKVNEAMGTHAIAAGTMPLGHRAARWLSRWVR